MKVWAFIFAGKEERMGKIVCKKCGHLNDETQIFCANCEEVLSDSAYGKKYLGKLQICGDYCRGRV